MFSHASVASWRRVTSPALYAARPNWNAEEPAISVRSRSKNAAPFSSGLRSAPPPGRRREDVRALGHTRRMIASPCPPPEQIAAQP